MPFPAAVSPCREWPCDRGRNARFDAQLSGIKSERFELPSPFGGRIAKSLDANTTGQAALDGGSDESRREEGKRDGHIDLTDAAAFASGDLFSLGNRARYHFV